MSETTISSMKRRRRGYPFGPIFFWTLVRDGHRARMHWARVLCFSIVAAVLVLAILANSSWRVNPDRFQRAGRELFMALTLTQVIISLLFAPLLTGGTISSERANLTLETLITTNITTTQLVLGKWFTRSFEMLVIILGLMPLSVVLMWFGGINWPSVLLAQAVVVLSVFLGGAVGIFFSSISRLAHTGGIRAFFFLPVFWVALSLFVALISERWFFARLISRRMGRAIVFMLTPFGPATLAFSGRMPFGNAVVAGSFIWNGLLCLVLLFAAVLVMRWRPLMSGAPASRRFGRWLVRGTQLLIPRRRERKGLTVKGNPIVWRELMRRSLGGWRLWLIVLIASWLGLAVVYAFSARHGLLFFEGVHIAILIISFCALLLTASISASISFAPEKELRTFDLLRMSDLSAREVLWGKCVGWIRFAAIPFSILFIDLLFVFVFFSNRHKAFLLLGGVSVAVDAAFFAMSGVLLSLLVRRTASAVSWSVGWLLVYCGGVPLLGVVVHELVRLVRIDMESWVTALMPGALPVLAVAEELTDGDVVVACMVHLAIFAAAVIGFAALCKWRLSRMMDRQRYR